MVPSRLRNRASAVAILVSACFLSGCAGTRMLMPTLSPVTELQMRERLQEGTPRSLMVPKAQREEFAREVAGPIHRGAMEMCERVFGPARNCAAQLSKFRLNIAALDDTVNAQINDQKHITLFGGLIKRVGSKDELAAVLAHEYAHGLMGHVGRKKRNIYAGVLLGALAGAAVAAATIDDDQQAAQDVTNSGARIGAGLGSLVYSQAMENEADHLSVFILREAGFNPKAASHFHMRLLNEEKLARGKQQELGLLYLRSHPGSEERIQKLMGAEKMLEAGHLQPFWKKNR